MRPLPYGPRRRQAGQGLTEYALLLALIAVLAIGGLTFAGGAISTTLADAGAAIGNGLVVQPPDPPTATPPHHQTPTPTPGHTHHQTPTPTPTPTPRHCGFFGCF